MCMSRPGGGWQVRINSSLDSAPAQSIQEASSSPGWVYWGLPHRNVEGEQRTVSK